MKNKDSIDKKFKELTKQDKMPISSIEDLMLEDLEIYKNDLLTHVEKMLLKNIDENDLIAKKRFLE